MYDYEKQKNEEELNLPREDEHTINKDNQNNRSRI